MDVRIEEEEITGVQSSGTRALKEGHKLVISAKEDGGFISRAGMF